MYFRLFVCVCLLAPPISGSLTPASLQSSLSSLISPNLCQLKLICAISKSENNQLRQSVFMRGISTLADLTAGTFLGNLTTDAFLLQYSIEAGECIFIRSPALIYCQMLMILVLRSDRPALQPCRPPVSVLWAGAAGRHGGARDNTWLRWQSRVRDTEPVETPDTWSGPLRLQQLLQRAGQLLQGSEQLLQWPELLQRTQWGWLLWERASTTLTSWSEPPPAQTQPQPPAVSAGQHAAHLPASWRDVTWGVQRLWHEGQRVQRVWNR